MIWRLLFVLFACVAVAACSASWDVGKGNIQITKGGGL